LQQGFIPKIPEKSLGHFNLCHVPALRGFNLSNLQQI
jgi:hypothetical protein